MALRIIVHDRVQREHSKHVFAVSPVRIGRSELADLPLHDDGVSLWHAVIRFDDVAVALYDLSSTNGTFVDGERIPIETPAPIGPRTQIGIGPFELWIQPIEHSPARPTTATVSLEGAPEAVHAAVQRIRPEYDAMLRGLSREVQEVLEALPEAAHAYATSVFEREFPGLGERDPMADATLAERLMPEAAPRDRLETAAFVRRVEAVLRAFADGVVGLHRGHEQIGNELGIRTIGEVSAIDDAARTSDHLLAYLLNPRASEAEIVQSLRGVFSDVMIHQIAFVGGVVAGARELLCALAPPELEHHRGRAWDPTKRAAWRAFVARHDALLTDPKAVHALLFGPAFTHAYSMVVFREGPRGPSPVPAKP